MYNVCISKYVTPCEYSSQKPALLMQLTKYMSATKNVIGLQKAIHKSA